MRERTGRPKWILLAVMLIAVLMGARSLPIGAWIPKLDAWVAEQGAWGIVVYGAVYALAAILFVPGSAMTLGAGAVFGVVKGTMMVSVASTVAAAGGFLVARYFARARIEAIARKNPKFNAIDQAVGEQGWKIVALLRLTPVVPYTLSNYFYGLTAVRFWPYVLTSWVAMLPGTVLYVYLGYAGRTGIEAASGDGRARDPLEYVYLGVGLVVTVLVTVYVTRLARTALRQTSLGDDGEANAAEQETTMREKPNGSTPHKRLVLSLILVGGLSVLCADTRLINVATAAWFGPKKVSLREAYSSRPDGPKINHATFDALLKKYVNAEGHVDYVGLKGESSELDAYLKTLAATPALEALDRNEALALLINAYNAATLRLILDYWPVKSIKDIPASKRWNDRRWKIGRLQLSLSQIENDYLRAKFIEPRIHFAINCASIGCPPLRSEAYTGANVDKQLAAQARYVHTNNRWLQFSRRHRRLHLTLIYDWYDGDFKQVAGSIETYAAQFNPDLAQYLDQNKSVTVRWLRYDWSINAAKP